MRKTILYVIFLALFLACEKELEIDYHSSEMLYVAEVLLTPDLATARVTRTRGVMESPSDSSFVTDAKVTIRMEGDPWADTLRNRGRGRYTSPYLADEGKEYIAEVIINGHTYTSRSTMRGAPRIKSFNFVWQDVVTEKMLFADLRLEDIPDENNYYFMHLYRNGVGYRWAVMSDRENPGAELQQLFSCTTKRDMDAGTGSDVLVEGDLMRVEVRSIDRPVYDYLYSLQLMNNTGTNPIANFSDGLLGYFSAYQVDVRDIEFCVDSIR